jgi:hypothetical protein
MARYLRCCSLAPSCWIQFIFAHRHSHTAFRSHFFSNYFQTLCCIVEACNETTGFEVVDALTKKVMEEYPTMNRNNFFFEFGGKPLSHDNTVSIGNGSTVFVQYRLRGGCFMISITVLMTIFVLILSSTCTCGASLLLVPLLLPFLFVLPLFCL